MAGAEGERAPPASARALRFGLAAGLALAAVAVFSATATAQTLVPAGALAANDTWNATGSPYILQGEVDVPAGLSLLINSGVRVETPAGAHLKVEGRLDALGTAGAVVNFKPSGTGTTWGGLEVEGDGSATVEYASIESADTGVYVSSTGAVSLTHVTISSVSGAALEVAGDSGGVTLDTVTIRDSGTAVSAHDGNVATLLTGLTVNNTGNCVVVTSASGLRLQSSSLQRCGAFGVSLSLASNITIASNDFEEWITTGVAIVSSSRVSVTQNTFYATAPTYGVELLGAANCTVADNTVDMQLFDRNVVFLDLPIGIYDLSPLGPNTILRNNVHAFFSGIRVEGAIFVQSIFSNTVREGYDTGIEILDSPNQTVRANTITGRDYPFAVNVTSRSTPWYYRQVVDANNTVDGRPILYLVGRSGGTINLTGGAGILALVDSDNVTVTGGNLSHGVPSLLIANSRDIVVDGATLQSNATSAAVVRSTRIALQNLSLEGGLTCLLFRDGTSNRASGVNTTNCLHALLTEGSESGLVVERLNLTTLGRVALFEGTNLTLRDAHISGIFETGLTNTETRLARGGQSVVLVGAPSGVLIQNVTIEAAKDAAVLTNFSDLTLRGLTTAQATTGLVLRQMSRVLINASAIAGTIYGVRADNLSDSRVENSSFEGASFEGILCVECTNVTFVGNLFAGNGDGIGFLGGSGCLLTRNLFFFNSLHASTNTSAHAFDDGAVGNLWDDYTGIDANNDGIGDTPYPIASGIDQDNYPIARFNDTVPPTADAGPDIVAYEDEPVLLSAYLSSDNVGIRVYLWSFVDGGLNITVPGLSTRYWFQTPGVYTVTLTVIDWGGNRATDTLVVRVLDRTPPHADAGGSRAVDEDLPVTLDGRGSFDNDPTFPAGAAFTWYVFDLNGTHVLFGPVASWTFDTPGNYTVRLVVDDAAGFSDTDTVYLTVRDRTPPVLGPLTAPLASEDHPFRVYAAAATDNDPNWPAGSTAWFELWRAGARLALTNQSPALFNVSDPGPCTVVYYLSDAAGNTASVNVSFNVTDITPPDVSKFGDRQGEAGEPVTFDLSPATDNDPAFPAGAIATWTFSIPSGSVSLIGAPVSFPFGAIGDYAVALHLLDAGGNLAETSFTVHIRDSKPPVLNLSGPVSLEAGALATFVANATDASDITEFEWHVSDLSTPRFGARLNYRFFVPGSYQVTVHVEDRLGHGTNASLTVVVVDTTPPALIVEFSPLPRGGVIDLAAGAVLQASFLGTDNSGITSVEWAWGDGTTSNGGQVVHNWSAGGNYTVRVRVVDGSGNANTTTVLVHVEPLPVAPPPPPHDQNATVTTASELPAVAVAGLIAAGAGAGVMIGFRVGRGRREREKPPEAG